MSSAVITSLRVWQCFAPPYYACLYCYHNWVILYLYVLAWQLQYGQAVPKSTLLFWKGKGVIWVKSSKEDDVLHHQGRYNGGWVINLVKRTWGKLLQSEILQRLVWKGYFEIALWWLLSESTCIFKRQQSTFVDSNPSRKKSFCVHHEMQMVVMFPLSDFHGHWHAS